MFFKYMEVFENICLFAPELIIHENNKLFNFSVYSPSLKNIIYSVIKSSC